MLVLTLSGQLTEDCEKKQDKRGHDYIKFTVSVTDTDIYGKPVTILFRCYCYNMQYDDLKKYDMVFVSGAFKMNRYGDKMNLDVHVQHISRGQNIPGRNEEK